MARQPKLLERFVPRAMTYHVAKALGIAPPPMLVTFLDVSGKVRRERLPL
jgi:hypothetical protein